MFLMPDHKWARLLAYVSGLVNQKLLLQNEYAGRVFSAPVAEYERQDPDGELAAFKLNHYTIVSSGSHP